MHEFSLCEGIISQVKKTRPNDNHIIRSVKVAIGEQSGVDIDSLKFWFPMVANKLGMPQLELAVDIIPAMVNCLKCNENFHLVNLFDSCPNCGSYAEYKFNTGKELLIKSVLLNDVKT